MSDQINRREQNIRRAQTLAAGVPLPLTYGDSGSGGTPVAPPLVGGVASGTFTGLLSMPPVGAEVAVLRIETGYPVGTVGIVTSPGRQASIPALPAGATAIYGARGEVLSYATATGATILYQNAANTLSIQVDPATNRINLVASGGLWVNGVQVIVP